MRIVEIVQYNMPRVGGFVSPAVKHLMLDDLEVSVRMAALTSVRLRQPREFIGFPITQRLVLRTLDGLTGEIHDARLL
jgi:hypothetical protein